MASDSYDSFSTSLYSVGKTGKWMIAVSLTLILLTWTIWRAPTNASKWRMGFNSAFKVLIMLGLNIYSMEVSFKLSALFQEAGIISNSR